MIKRLTLTFIFTAILAVTSGCGRENEAAVVKQNTKSRDELAIQNALESLSDWREHFGLLYVRHGFLSELHNKILYSEARTLYAKYIGSYLNVAFGIPLDATEVGTRTRQFDSFATITDAAISCLEEHDDFSQYWKYALRRLEVIGSELKKIEEYVKGNGGEQNFSGTPKDWTEYYDRVRRDYGYSKKSLISLVNNFLMVHVLPFEEWFTYLLRLEAIVGEEIPIKPEPYRLWKEKQMKANSVSTNLVEVFRRVELYRAVQKENGRWSGRPGDLRIEVEGL